MGNNPVVLRAWRERHPDKVEEYRRRDLERKRAKHRTDEEKERRAEYMKQYYAENREYLLRQNKLRRLRKVEASRGLRAES